MIISCNYQNRKVNFERDLPDYKNGISRDLTGLQASRDALKLDTLENGYDSIQIRVWFTYARIDTFQILSLKKTDHKWSAYYCKTGFQINPGGDSILSYSKDDHEIFPKSGWQTVMDSIFNFNILTLPDCRKIKGYDFPFDGGNSVTFEISTEKKYRLYMYELPSKNKEYKEAANVDSILRLLSEEFHIKYLGNY